jgi:outer membrane protein insertion porin family
MLPLDMHSKGEINATRRAVMDALAGGLHSAGAEIVGIDELKDLVFKEGIKKFDDRQAFEISKKVKADFAILGSLTRLGRTTNVDLRIIDLKSKGVLAQYYKSSPSEADLLRKLKVMATPVYEKMLSAIKARQVARSGIIDSIVVSGNMRVDTAAIMQRITSKEGTEFSPDNLREDIRSLYGTGYFDDITADLSETATAKILTFTVKEMPYIKKVVLEGNKEISDDSLSVLITIKPNTVLDRVLLSENAEKIKAYYADEGFYLAAVTPVVEDAAMEATVIFKIDEGDAVKVKRITIIGNEAYTDKKIKKIMSTKEVGLFSSITKSSKFAELLFQNDMAMIMGEYYDNGFIQASIVEHSVLLSEDKKWFYITIAVTEGPSFNIGTVDLTGDILTTKREVFEKIEITEGEVFSRTRLSKDLDALTELYGDEGYAYAEIKPLTRINLEEKTIDITFDIKKHDLVYIERIDIKGNTRTRDKVIRRELEAEEGKLYSHSAIKKSRNNLRRLGYFEDVIISRNQGSSSDKIKLNIEIKERPTGSISIGMGYSSVDKIIGTAAISQSNFMGTGIKLDLSGTTSSSSSRYVLGFTEPWLFDKPISAGFDLYNTEREYPDFKIRKNGFGVRLGWPIKKKYTRMNVNYKLEDVNIFDVAANASNFILDQEGTTTESAIRTTIRRDTRDDAFFPTEGSVLSLTAEVAGGALGGTSYFTKYEGNAVKYFALPWETTISVRATLGHVEGYSGRTEPIYERYYLGGINSIRGFLTRSISPKDEATGDLIGGKTMMVSNIEFVFPIAPRQNIKGLLFFDAGNSYESGIDLSDIRIAAGGGIRWFSPMGPLRIELGFNLDPREDEEPQQWDFTIGTAF